MPRTVKDPDERRNEIIDIAEELFLEKGYEQTAVSDIVKTVGVAQGTFYYYFKSKENVLNSVIDRHIEEIRVGLEAIAARDDLSAMDKIVGLSTFLSGFNEDRKNLFDYIHEDRNAHLHLKFENAIPPVMIPLFERIIKEGVHEGIFDTKHPMEAALVIINSNIVLFERTFGLEEILGSPEERYSAAIDFIERILGAKPGIFKEYGLGWEEGSNE
ncbi:MAG: TetR/AcrR family transcriptional regulator [Halobacteriota archaeon]|nr:TetR/AcrR family transcriptional regulator [Halobacteriota archaeon]